MSIRENVKQARCRAQQRRLVNEDFPWLWAVRDRWYFGRGLVAVAKVDHHLTRFLIRPRHLADAAEVWVRYGNEETLTAVRRVTLESTHTCWAEAIMHSIAVGQSFLNIVVIEPLNEAEETEFVAVYRPPKPHRTFNPFIVEVARSFVTV